MSSEEMTSKKKSRGRSGSLGKTISMKKGKKESMRKSRTKFEEFLAMDMNKGVVGAKEDLEMERRLAKKLKVKGGKFKNSDDGINKFIKGIPSVLDDGVPLGDEIVTKDGINGDEKVMKPVSSGKKRKRKKSSQPSTRPEDETVDGEEDANVLGPISASEEHKMKKSFQPSGKNPEHGSGDDLHKTEEDISGEDNMEPGTLNEEPPQQAPIVDVSAKYLAPHLRACANKESEELSQIRRRVRGLLNRLSESNVESITEEVAAIFQSLSRSVGCEVIGEEVVASCSRGPRSNEHDLLYDLLSTLSKRLTEMDVSTILTILQCCGMKLRGDDPTAMKDFVVSIQNRVNEAKSLSQSEEDGKLKINNKRMEFMLDTICDIKNNKKRQKEDPAHHTRIKKWLQKLRAEDILLRGLKWSKLLDPQKKGQWWLSGEIASAVDNVDEVATTISKEVQETQKLMQLAAAQRMNTDLRRAIFCIIMSGEDYIDTFEKILKLDLSGKQDREIMRVLVACCLQEKVFNKYYTVLASKLCGHDKNHKFTLQYCIWDHYKELDTMELVRSMNLARFVAEMLSSFSLSLALLKAVDLLDPAQLTPRRIVHFRMLMEAIFDNSDALVWNIFTRVAASPELEMLRTGLLFFIKQYVVAAKPEKSVAAKYKIVRKALQNVAGVLM